MHARACLLACMCERARAFARACVRLRVYISVSVFAYVRLLYMKRRGGRKGGSPRSQVIETGPQELGW